MNTTITPSDIAILKAILPIIVLNILLVVIALVDLIRHHTHRDKFWLWFFLILFVNLFGPIAYFIFGRRE